MPLTTEIWVNDIAEQLFRDNGFIDRSIDETAFVENNKITNPISGGKPGTVINRTSLPATISERTDTHNSYELAELTSNPTLIRDIDEIETNYDKRQSVIAEHVETIREQMANYIAHAWSATIAGNIVRTSGDAKVASSPGATGNRKRFKKSDLLEARRILDRMDVPNSGRVALLTSEMYNDLIMDPEVLNSQTMGSANLPSGAVARLFGFDIYIRSSVVTFDNTSTPVLKALGAANATTDNEASIIYHDRFVKRAYGDVKAYADEDKPEYYGSIFSCMARVGGAKRYGNTLQKGIISIVEAAAQ